MLKLYNFIISLDSYINVFLLIDHIKANKHDLKEGDKKEEE